MALVTTIEQYNDILQIKTTQNKVVYEMLDSSQIIGLDNLWLMMVKDAKEANNTGSSVSCEDETGSNYSWSSC